MVNRKEDYQESYEQTIITLVLSVTGMLFSCVCLAVNIAYRKHRLDIKRETSFCFHEIRVDPKEVRSVASP